MSIPIVNSGNVNDNFQVFICSGNLRLFKSSDIFNTFPTIWNIYANGQLFLLKCQKIYIVIVGPVLRWAQNIYIYVLKRVLLVSFKRIINVILMFRNLSHQVTLIWLIIQKTYTCK